jgi:hypothetical protein
MNDNPTTSLQAQVRSLPLEMPDDLAARALRSASRPHAAVASEPQAARRPARSRSRLALVGLAAAVAVAVLANAGLGYLLPSYGRALADTPVIGPVAAGPLLRWTGLAPSQVAEVDQTVTAGGHAVRLVGAEADPIRTLLFFDVDGRSADAAAGSNGYVVALAQGHDQFMNSYDWVPGPEHVIALRLEPLRGPAATYGARLDVHVSSLEMARGAPHEIGGSWDFHLTLSPQPAASLAVPASMSAGASTYRVTSVQQVQGMLEVRWTVAGEGADSANGAVGLASWDFGMVEQPDGLAPRYSSFGSSQSVTPNSGRAISPQQLLQQRLWPHLYGPDGKQIYGIGFHYAFARGEPAVGVLDVLTSGSGRYQIAFGDPGQAFLAIDVPRR